MMFAFEAWLDMAGRSALLLEYSLVSMASGWRAALLSLEFVDMAMFSADVE